MTPRISSMLSAVSDRARARASPYLFLSFFFVSASSLPLVVDDEPRVSKDNFFYNDRIKKNNFLINELKNLLLNFVILKNVYPKTFLDGRELPLRYILARFIVHRCRHNPWQNPLEIRADQRSKKRRFFSESSRLYRKSAWCSERESAGRKGKVRERGEEIYIGRSEARAQVRSVRPGDRFWNTRSREAPPTRSAILQTALSRSLYITSLGWLQDPILGILSDSRPDLRLPIRIRDSRSIYIAIYTVPRDLPEH